MNNFTFLAVDSSRLTALRKLEISTYSRTFAPCQTGASTPRNVKLFIHRSLVRIYQKSSTNTTKNWKYARSECRYYTMISTAFLYIQA